MSTDGILQAIDRWISEGSFSPALIALGMAGLVAAWVVAPAMQVSRQKGLGATQRRFYEAYLSAEETSNRRRFRWNLERAYRSFDGQARVGDLPALLQDIEWPRDFPPSGNLYEYAHNIVWPNKAGEVIWRFMTDFFGAVIAGNGRSKHLTEPHFSGLLNARFVVSNFWDHWAREMLEGRLSPESVRKPLDENICDIRALAVSELALAKALGWDKGPGRESLFLLARDDSKIAGGPIRRTIRRWVPRRTNEAPWGSRTTGQGQAFQLRDRAGLDHR